MATPSTTSRKLESLHSRAFPSSNLPLLALSGLLAAGYFLFSFKSQGLLSDEEITHFYSSLAFLQDPASALSSWARPGFKLVYALPSWLGHGFLVAAMALTSAFTAYFAACTAKRLGIRHYGLAFVFTGVAPLFFQMSGRPYTEVFAAFLVSLLLFLYVSNRFVASALTCSFLLTVRLEFAVVAAVMGILFLRKKRHYAVGALALVPIILGFLGYLKTGKPLWLLTDYMSGKDISELDIPRRGFWHYTRMYFAVFGATGGALALIGFFGFAPSKLGGKGWEYAKRHHVLYLVGSCVFLLQSVLSSNLVDSPSPGKLTYIVPIVSIVGIFANLGFSFLWHSLRPQRIYAASALVICGAITFLFLSFEHNYLFFVEEADYSGTVVLALLLLASVILFLLRVRVEVMLAALCVLGIGHTVYVEKPIEPNAEHKAVAAMAEWHQRHQLEGRVTLVSHPYFYFKRGALESDPTFGLLQLEALENAPSGSIVIWDSHYGYHPRRKFNVPHEVLSTRPDKYQLLKKVTASEDDPLTEGGRIVRFGIWAYGKL